MTSQSVLDLVVLLSIITESVFARFISAMKEERVAASKLLKGPKASSHDGDPKEFIESIRKALYTSKIAPYAQGFAQMRAASDEYKWELDYGRISIIFRGGCIIRAAFLQNIKDAYDRDPDLRNLVLDQYFRNVIANYQEVWRNVLSITVTRGIPLPSFASALAYYDSYRAARLPAKLLQTRRDYFGRIDKEGSFHIQWME
jgi:6-phosphogluconate dehydrogenase